MQESISHQILYVAILLLIILDFGYLIYSRIRKKEIDWWMVFPRLCVYVGLIYWFVTIPQVKYCWSFLIFPVAVVPAYYWEKSKEKHSLIQKGMLAIAIALFLMYSGFYSLRTLGYVKDGVSNYPIMQADYKTYNFGTVEKNGQTFYVRIEGGDLACGYHHFPYLDNQNDLDRLVVGDNLREGFYFETNDK